MSNSYVAALIPQIRGYLTSSDLSSISAKRIRKQLIESGHDASTIKDNREAIDQEIEKLYTELTENSPPPPATPSSSLPLNPPSSFPRALSIKTEHKPRVKASPPSTPDRKPNVVTASTSTETDEQMALRLQREFDNQGSSGSNGRSARASRSAANGVAPKKKKARVKRKVADGEGSGEEGGVKKKKRAGGGNGAFNKELILSDALSDLVGVPRLSRPQVVKHIWEYVKEKDLQDPSDKRYIRCDEPLKRVFHTDRLHMFTMNKILVAHVMDPEEVHGAGERGVERKPVASSQGSATSRNGGSVKVERKPVLSQPEIVSSDEDDESDEED